MELPTPQFVWLVDLKTEDLLSKRAALAALFISTTMTPAVNA